MKLRLNKVAITLLELLLAIALVSVIVLGFSSLDIYSHFQVISADRRSKIQSELSYVLEHISKQTDMAIGNEKLTGANSVVDITPVIPGQDTASIQTYIDANKNGKGDDYWIAYRLRFNPQNERYQLWYCEQCGNNPCAACVVSWEILSRKITNFQVVKPINPDSTLRENWVEIQITSCYDPDGIPLACGRPLNPTITLSNRIKMPCVATN